MVAAVNRRPRAAAARGLETRGRAGRAQRHSSQHPAGASGAHNWRRGACSSAPPRSRLGAGKTGDAGSCSRSGFCSCPCSRRGAGSRSSSNSSFNSSEYASGRGLCGNRGQRGPHGCGARGRCLRGGDHPRCRDNGGGSRRLHRSSTATGGVASSCGRATRGRKYAARWRKYAVRCGKSAAHGNRRAGRGAGRGGLDAPQ